MIGLGPGPFIRGQVWLLVLNFFLGGIYQIRGLRHKEPLHLKRRARRKPSVHAEKKIAKDPTPGRGVRVGTSLLGP